MSEYICKKSRINLDSVSVIRAKRGYVARVGELGQYPTMYAFDRIEDLAEWLIEQMGEPEGEA